MIKTRLINDEYVNNVIRVRDRNVHKGDCGRLLIIAGSVNMTGAAVLCAKGAFRGGAGLVNVCIPEEAFPVVQITVPEVICISRVAADIDYNKFDGIAIGPGMGVCEGSRIILEKILSKYNGILTIDADGLTVIANNNLFRAVQTSTANVIMTPHMGEAHRLLDVLFPGRSYIQGSEKLDMANCLADATNATIVLKGADSLVASKASETYINTTGNPGMATAGSGDVLTGVITALAGQGYSAADAARLGVYIHGLAGDIAGKKIGRVGIMAGDIADNVSTATERILQKKLTEHFSRYVKSALLK